MATYDMVEEDVEKPRLGVAVEFRACGGKVVTQSASSRRHVVEEIAPFRS